MGQKIKYFFLETPKGQGILSGIIFVLIGLVSFLLGRLSKSNFKPGIQIEYQETKETNVISAPTLNETNPTIPVLNPKGNYFASKRGKKYYSIDCSAGKSIKLENRVYFDTKEEAERAGYEPSASCTNR